MQRYSEYQPTGFDPKGLALDDKQDWLVLPCGRNRDSGVRQESNFHCALAMLGGESWSGDGGNVEVHRFGHWACGWFEIIIVRPDTKEAKEAESIECALADYPVLDDSDVSDREHEAEWEAWGAWGARDMRRHLREGYPGTEGRWSAVPVDVLFSAYHNASDENGVYVEHSDEGPDFDFEGLFRKADMRSYVRAAIAEHRRIGR
jgi:hypothetical protein